VHGVTTSLSTAIVNGSRDVSGKALLDLTPHRRRRLIDLSPATHCSLIGTCLSTAELRKILRKIIGDGIQSLSEHEVHKHGVQLCSQEGLPTKLLNKALEEKYAGIIRKLAQLKAESDIEAFWAQAKKEGQIEGAYWAIATHPAVSEAFFTRVFGDVHMLSHLVGSANRADIKRLVRLESQVSELSSVLESTKAAMRAGFSQRDKEIERLQRLVASNISAAANLETVSGDEEETLRKLTSRLHQQLASETGRRHRFETERDKLKAELSVTQRQLLISQERSRQLEIELQAIEEHETALNSPETNSLTGKVILYVGGKSATIPSLRNVIERLGGAFLHHDGGKEQKSSLLRGLISRADCVFFPVDFVSHDAMHLVRRYCDLDKKPFFALSRSSAASLWRGVNEYIASGESLICV
jgi:hypothetical protein